jgi:hypothetical protein
MRASVRGQATRGRGSWLHGGIETRITEEDLDCDRGPDDIAGPGEKVAAEKRPEQVAAREARRAIRPTSNPSRQHRLKFSESLMSEHYSIWGVLF